MNIFLIMLMSLFMAGYYMFFAPNTRVREQETERAIVVSDLRSVAECTIAVHNATIAGGVFDDVCVAQNDIKTSNFCLDSRGSMAQCDGDGSKRAVANFIVTTTAPLDISDYNNMMEILEQSFATSGSFGLFQDGFIMAGGTTSKRTVPDAVQKQLNLENGQLVYMTHYENPGAGKVFTVTGGENIVCPAGTNKTYRFGRWQCIGYNFKTTCGGDMMWDNTLSECVPDESRKPLCTGNQTAVMVENLWECVDPFAERQCPTGMLARLNYETLEWECVEDPTNVKPKSKCTIPNIRVVRGRDGATLRLASTSCTDCEKMLINETTCDAVCVPDPTKITSPSCYPGRVSECSGPSRALYFGFPNAAYVANVTDVANLEVPFDGLHSQNRKFNCFECPTGIIDGSRSVAPYVAVCTNRSYAKTSSDSEFDASALDPDSYWEYGPESEIMPETIEKTDEKPIEKSESESDLGANDLFSR